MDDKARPHRANIVDECLQSEDITRMNWPAYSPDLDPSLADELQPINHIPPVYRNFGEHCLMSGVIFPKIRLIILYSACLGVGESFLNFPVTVLDKDSADVNDLVVRIEDDSLNLFAVKDTRMYGNLGNGKNTFFNADGDLFNGCQVIYSQFSLAIHQNDHQARRRFAEWAQNEIAVVPDFHKRILFSDEAHFWLNGYVNKQNCRIWSEANPQVDDNAQPHRSLAVEELLESEDITRMDWPAYSPDLNPLEHVWDALGRHIAARLHHPENTQQLKQMLIEGWALLPQEMLHPLVLSMRRRCEATIAVRGGHTPY
ncbi:transposable element Tcb2 transposase [Trichonephila clavipes]|nr:transposable element Tcb2 transposase [Trichonephila clavipes]